MELKLSLRRVLVVLISHIILGPCYADRAAIETGIAKAICDRYKTYKATNEANRIVRSEAAITNPPGLIRWIKCDTLAKPCNQFVLEGSALDPDHGRRDPRAPVDGSPSDSDPKEELNIIVTLRDQKECSGMEIPKTRSFAQRRDISSDMNSLKQHAEKSQKAILDKLKGNVRSSEFKMEALWLKNVIIISGAKLSDVQAALQGQPEVQSVREEVILNLSDEPSSRQRPSSMTYEEAIDRHWGVKEVNAPDVWARGYNGSGVVIGIIDTGVNVSHEVLVDNFRKDYGWFDPREHSAEPKDFLGTGTSVIGAAVGTRGIGAAPGAQFIVCRACFIACSESALLKCAQWMYCPTDTSGQNPDCTKRPHILLMGLSEDQNVFTRPAKATYVQEFVHMVNCWRSAGMIPVGAIGNKAECETLAFPGVLSTFIGVGNAVKLTSEARSVCGHQVACSEISSQGPIISLFNGTASKPDVIAPGTDIVTTFIDGKYSVTSGTSYATSLVAGTVALMLQRNPTLTFDEIREALTATALPTSKVTNGNRRCGGISEDTYPNSVAGFGLIDGLRAIRKVRAKH